MRSRYSAFALGRVDHLLRSWHTSTRPRSLVLDEGMQWRRLVVLDTVAGGPWDSTGVVEFVAHYVADGVRGSLHERSTFVREDGWQYVDGTVG